jgi:hypothetical protein
MVGARGHGLETLEGRVHAAVLQAPWLLPYGKDLQWLVPTATLALLPFYFLVSAVVERAVLVRSLTAHDRRRVAKAVWLANAASYGLLLAATAVWLWCSQVPPLR